LSITVSDVSFSYGRRHVLDKINVSVGEGQLLSVVGPNGVGKSTLFRCILGLQTGFEGDIRINGNDIRGLGVRKMAKLVAFIPQGHYPSFNFSVFDMVLMGTTNQISSVSTPGKQQLKLVESALDRMRIFHLKDRGYSQISGGERQLVLVARALVQQTQILILDEPTANLDFGNQIRVLTQIRSLAREGYTIIQSTHNPEHTFMFSDWVLALHQGKVLANGVPADIVTTDLMRRLYDIDVEVQSLYQDKVRVCIPSVVIGNNQKLNRRSTT
jgi:iron complex transport system ATP-binding protein